MRPKPVALRRARVDSTLKEQLLWVRTFETVEELRLALIEWAELYNEQWLIERHGFRSPAQRRRDYCAEACRRHFRYDHPATGKPKMTTRVAALAESEAFHRMAQMAAYMH